MPYLVFLDANVLFSKILLTIFLDMAELEIFSFLWSDEVIKEVTKNLKLKGVNPQSVDKLEESIKSAFKMGEVEKNDYKSLEQNLSKTDPKDRHVLAAASIAGAQYLVTFNLSDFDVAEATSQNVQVIHPDDFLSFLYTNHTNEIVRSIKHSRGRRTRPVQTENEFLDRLNKSSVVSFATTLSTHLGHF